MSMRAAAQITVLQLGLNSVDVRLILFRFVPFFAGRDGEAVAAFGAFDVFVPAHERGRHRAGRNNKRFGLEGAK